MKQIEPKARRKFTVPAKYRCRVCQKIYLGDRKMARHIKAYPTHGPSEGMFSQHVEESVPASIVPPPQQDKKISPSSLSMPIIPLARTQLEELVKNLDAELVLDCVSKKMFDNFSMWDLQLKKMQLNKEKGLKRLEILLKDMEDVTVELKKMVDNCLTHTKLCDKPSPSVTIGEHLQLALNSHDGPLYLEQPNHIPEEYHKYFGIQPIISSPRSESNTIGNESLVTNPDDEDNSNSMMSGTSDKDHQGLGAQMVLEQNLGVCVEEEEDEDSNSKINSEKRPESSSLLDSNSKIDSLLHDEDSNMSDEHTTKKCSKVDVSESVITPVVSSVSVTSNVMEDQQQQQLTRLPSFSSIIAKPELQDIHCLVDQADTPQVPVVEDHHSVPSSRRGSFDADSRPSVDRRCSLDQTALLATMNTTSQQDSLVRRASIDNGLMMSTTLETGFVDTFATNTTADITGVHHDLLTTLDDPECPTFANAVVTTTSKIEESANRQVANSNAFSNTQPNQQMNEMFESVVTSTPTSMSVATMDAVASSTHVTFSQQVLVSGVQSLPPSGPPSVHNEPRHASMPSSPLANNQDLVSKEDDFKTSTSSNFLISELESVLGSAGDFSFTTPSPEKLLASIPPMMLNKTNTSSNEQRSTSQRTDFLGALGGKSVPNTATNSPNPADINADKESKNNDDVDLNSYDDGQSEHLIRSTLADVTHFPNSAPSKSNADSLSQLFDEIPSNPANEQETQ